MIYVDPRAVLVHSGSTINPGAARSWPGIRPRSDVCNISPSPSSAAQNHDHAGSQQHSSRWQKNPEMPRGATALQLHQVRAPLELLFGHLRKSSEIGQTRIRISLR